MGYNIGGFLRKFTRARPSIVVNYLVCMNKIRRAIITAAGRGTREYPATASVQKELFPIVDRDGFTRPVLQIIVEEALTSGIENICIITNPTNDGPIRSHFQPLSKEALHTQFAGKEWAERESNRLAEMRDRITFVQQRTQDGFGHAVLQAKSWAGDEPFAVTVGDHVYTSCERGVPCLRQVLDVAERDEQCAAVSSVWRAPEIDVPRYGTVRGRRVIPGTSSPLVIEQMVEKPSLAYAREHLKTDGLPVGEHLCFFGIHAFPTEMFLCLEEVVRNNIRVRGEFQLTSAQELLLNHGVYYACEVFGRSFDMGVPEGYLKTQLAIALESVFAESVRELFVART